MTITLSAAHEKELADISAANGLAPEIMAGRAIEQFLFYRENLEDAVEEARVAAGRGDSYDHVQVKERLAKLLAS